MVVLTCLKLFFSKKVILTYPLASTFAQQGMNSRHIHKKLLNILRIFILVILALLIARPQLVDLRSLLPVEGIDIILALDVSGSMEMRDDKKDKRMRIDIAKEEALRFVQKRENDALGLVLFGNIAISKCPLTFDKNILKDSINDISLGFIDPNGTVLATGLTTAINRLKKSKSKSKVIILLTDGEPSEWDMDPNVAIKAAQQLDIKIYTIGIGSDEVRQTLHPFYGRVQLPRVNTQLLDAIAQQTGGQSFLAKNPKEMRAVYDTIDALEKTEYEMPVYSKFYELYIPFVWFILLIMVLEIFTLSFVWFGL